jgi:hypothetical protein
MLSERSRLSITPLFSMCIYATRSNYTGVTNTNGAPYNFCAYTWAPFRNRLPDNPTHFNGPATTSLQNDYIPNSHNQNLETIGTLPTGGNQGDAGGPS